MADASKPKIRKAKVNDAALEKLGFAPVGSDPPPRRLIVCVEGEEKTGKTTFGLSGPEPIFFVSLDVGTEGVVEKFSGKDVRVLEVSLPRGAGIADYEKSWTDLQEAVESVLQYSIENLSPGDGTLVIDTDTERWELARLAFFGKLTQVKPHHYGPVNAVMRRFIRDIYETGINAALLHKLKPLYVDDKRTDRLARSGFGDTEYLSQINIRMFREPNEDGGVEFGLKVLDCRRNADTIGDVWTGDLCNFDWLLGTVHD